jgi:ParB/Sulfiredoxin domain
MLRVREHYSPEHRSTMSRAPKQPATPKPPPPVLERMTKAAIGPVFTIPLDQIVLAPEVYRHRAATDLEPKKIALKELADNLIAEGQRDPVVVYKDQCPADPARPYVLVAGHRRHAALLLLCDKNTPNFAYDMPVKAREIEGGSKADYLLLSVSDNLFHEPLDSHHLTLAAVALLEAGCSHTRIKVNLRLSDSTFARCKRLHESQWMLGHIERDELGLTDVHTLLEAAGGKGGPGALEHLKSDLARIFTAVQKEQIDTKSAELAEQGKELKGADAKVKSYLPKHLIKSWVLALKRGERLQAQAEYHYDAAIVQEKMGKRVQIPHISMPLVEGEFDRLYEITLRLDQLVRQLRPQLAVMANSLDSTASTDGDDPSTSESEAAGLGDVAAIRERLNRRKQARDEPDSHQNWGTMEEPDRKPCDPMADLKVAATQPSVPADPAPSTTRDDGPTAAKVLSELKSMKDEDAEKG